RSQQRPRPSSLSGPSPERRACPIARPAGRPESLHFYPPFLSFPLSSSPCPLPLSSVLHTLSKARFGGSRGRAVFLRAPPGGRTRGDRLFVCAPSGSVRT